MLLVAAVTPHTTAGAHRHYGTCLCSVYRAEAPALCVPVPASRGCFSRIHSEGTAGQRALPAQLRGTKQRCGMGVFFQHWLRNRSRCQSATSPSVLEGKNPTQRVLVTNMQLLNMVALWFSSKAGDQATLLQRGNRTAT